MFFFNWLFGKNEDTIQHGLHVSDVSIIPVQGRPTGGGDIPPPQKFMPGGCERGGECGCSPPSKSFSLNDYQEWSALYDEGHSVEYYALGLGEAGEVQGKIKKVERDHDGVLTLEMREAIRDELGDLLWYTSRLAAALGYTLEEVANRNVEKLTDRYNRGVLRGSGDNR